RILRQVHAVPDRLGARRRGHRPGASRRASLGEPRGPARPMRYDDARIAVRDGRADSRPGAERARAFPRRLRPAPRPGEGRPGVMSRLTSRFTSRFMTRLVMDRFADRFATPTELPCTR